MAIGAGYVHYKFQTEKHYHSLQIQENFISLRDLKQIIFQTKFRDRRNGVQLVAFNAQTGEQYHNDQTDLIMKNTSVILRRLPIQCLLPIVADNGIKPMNSTPITSPCPSLEATLDLDDFGDDPFAAPQPPKPNTPQLFEPWKIPQGYVCRRCGISGHLIQQCPTNADTMYNKKRWIKPSAVAVAVSKPGEAAFDSFWEGISSSSSSSRTSVDKQLPPELYCPLCKQVMKDAVIASKCCFDSFCDRCIRSQLMSKSACICKATTTRPDNLLPNMTLRETIARLLESKPISSSSGSTKGAETTISNISVQAKQQKLHPRSSLDACQRGQDLKRHKSSFPIPNCSAPAMSHATGAYNLPVWNAVPQGHFWRQASSISVV